MKQLIGVVLAKKMPKTAKILVERIKIHPLYRKRIKIKKSYQVHDELDVKVGDRVKFQSCRPFSKTKRWKIIEVIDFKKNKKKEKKA